MKHQRVEERNESESLFRYLSDNLDAVLSRRLDWELQYVKLIALLLEKRLIRLTSSKTKNAASAGIEFGFEQSRLINIGESETPWAVRDVYSTLNGDLRVYADLPKGRSCHSSLLLDNQLYCIGGLDVDDDIKELSSKLVFRLDNGHRRFIGAVRTS